MTMCGQSRTIVPAKEWPYTSRLNQGPKGRKRRKGQGAGRAPALLAIALISSGPLHGKPSEFVHRARNFSRALHTSAAGEPRAPSKTRRSAEDRREKGATAKRASR